MTHDSYGEKEKSAASGPMSSRRRFRETMAYGSPDRVPYFEEGIRPEVLKAWRRQGMERKADPAGEFPSDPRIEIEPDLEPRPALDRLPATRADLAEFRRRLDPTDSGRLPRRLKRTLRRARAAGAVRMLRVHRGLFLSMGVAGWNRFYDLMRLLGENPQVVREAMAIQGDFAAALAERILDRTEVEAAIFSEPIGGNHGPLISPDMYDDVVLSSYDPLISLLKRRGVETLILRTYANARVLIPKLLERGFTCIWACEVDIGAMDYRSLRREFGKALRLIGGIDLDSLHRSRAAVDRELDEKARPLLADGGYVPLADGRVRADVPYDTYRYYRRRLQDLILNPDTSAP
jgi:hypothetical protein